MKVQRNDHNQSLTAAEMEACQQIEGSNRKGQALFYPQVAAGQPAPNCVVFLEEIGRFAVTVLEGRYTVENGQWSIHEADGAATPVDSPLEQAWQGAKSIRTELKRELELNTYVIAVVWFRDMDEDEDILDEADGHSVRVFFASDDLAQRLPGVPRDDEVQSRLSGRYIKQEVGVLRRAGAVATPQPAEDSTPVNGRAGALTFQRVDTVNIYVTVANGGADDDPPLITVQGQ